MPENGLFAFSLIIADNIVKEYWSGGKCYVPINLHTKDSYVIEESLDDTDHTSNGNQSQGSLVYTKGQRYPVTPFKIQIRKSVFEPCWVSVEMDGEHICYRLLCRPNHQSSLLEGWKCGNEIRELAFSLPLMTGEMTGAKKKRIDAAGSITVQFIEAVNQGLERYMPPTRVKTNYLPQGEFPQLTKQDVSRKDNLGAVIREGRTFLKLMYDNHQKPRFRTRYTRGKLLTSITVHYRPLESLLDLGIISQDEYKHLKTSMTTDTIEPFVPLDTQQTNSEDDEKKHSVQKMINNPAIIDTRHMLNTTTTVGAAVKGEVSCERESKVATVSYSLKQEFLATQSQFYIHGLPKVEKKGEEMMAHFDKMKIEMVKNRNDVICIDDDDDEIFDACVHDDDGVVCLGDESVIYLGDDSCYVFDTTPQEISIVDLTDDIPS